MQVMISGHAQLPIAARCIRRALYAAIPGVLLMTGCGHKRTVAAAPPPPPPIRAAPAPEASAAAPPPAASAPEPGGAAEGDAEFVSTHRPIYSETGIASWYGPPYNNRRGADGKVYNENHISAAHRTLPMGSLIRVTNVRTGQSAIMHVTDRGPFVAGRILDLSVGAARAVGIWRAGTGEVRIDVYSTPRPMDEGGRWCVQVGAFSHAGAARRLQSELERKYRTANVIEFQGPTGYWVRIRPENDNRTLAMEIAHRLRPSEGDAWLVRLD